MPFLWIGLSSLAGIITGTLWEKETTKKVVEVANKTAESAPAFTWWDKMLMAGAGLAALWIWKKAK